jgi:LuxR family maltose regulon positive regulatory protein
MVGPPQAVTLAPASGRSEQPCPARPAARRPGRIGPPQGVPLSCLARLVQAFDGKGAASGSKRSAAPAVPRLVEPLTSRELEVLGMLAGGTPNQRIAEELVITLDTVKKHVSHVLGKLGVANRTEAVARARELGLIS